MINNPFIYMRGLRHAAFTVFCVSDGQKSYYEPQFNTRSPYSSGQQVKRSIMEAICDDLGVEPSPTEFVFDIDKKKALGEGEVLSICNPQYVDQLLGGWMRTPKGGKERTLKRRSPLSISAMTPLHPLLASVPTENVTFDRSDRPNVHKVTVRDSNGNVLTSEQVDQFLNGSERSLLRKWIPNTKNSRATGLFVYDVAIDLRRLFSVATNQMEPELAESTIEALRNDGWVESRNVFGPCLVLPKERREQVIPALAHALINWHITSNQSRTFSLMETLAVAISDNANDLAAAIRAKLVDADSDRPKAKPIVDGNTGADLYVALPCASYIATENERADALKQAENDLAQRMLAFDYEQQQVPEHAVEDKMRNSLFE